MMWSSNNINKRSYAEFGQNLSKLSLTTIHVLCNDSIDSTDIPHSALILS